MRIAQDRLDLSVEATNAITRGIERGDAVCEMELMGLSQRIINTLEESDHSVIFLSELIDLTVDDIINISNIGETAVRQICTILNQYDKLEKMILNERKRENAK